MPDLGQLVPSLYSEVALAPFRNQLADTMASAATQLLPRSTINAATQTAIRALGITATDLSPVLAWESLTTIDPGWIRDLAVDLPPLNTFLDRSVTDLLASSTFQNLTDTFTASMKTSIPDLSAFTAATRTASAIQLDSWRYSEPVCLHRGDAHRLRHPAGQLALLRRPAVGDSLPPAQHGQCATR